MSFNAIPEFNENELETVLFVGHDITEAKQIEMEIKDKNNKINESRSKVLAINKRTLRFREEN